MNRNQLKQLAAIRLKEARALLKNRTYDGCYYFCGYVIECGLKACIAKKTKRFDFPDKNTVVESYTHDLTKLMKIAGLELILKNKIKRNRYFAVNWGIVKDWAESSRYEQHDRKEAQALYRAIINRKYGVLKWLKRHW